MHERTETPSLPLAFAHRQVLDRDDCRWSLGCLTRQEHFKLGNRSLLDDSLARFLPGPIRSQTCAAVVLQQLLLPQSVVPFFAQLQLEWIPPQHLMRALLWLDQ